MKRIRKSELAFRDAFMAERIGIRGMLQAYLTILLVFILSLIWICQVALLFSFYQNYRSGQVQKAAEMIVNNINHEELNNLADRVSAENEVCLMLLDAEGTEILSIDHVRFCVLHHLKRPELMRLVDSAPPDGTEYVEMMNVFPFQNEKYRSEDFEGEVPEEDPLRGRSMMHIQRVFFEDGSWGTLLINAQINPTRTIMNLLRRQLIYIVLLVLAASILIGFFMARSVTRPIIETNRAARALSRGKYTRPPHGGGYREIAELNDTLVRAAEDLHRVEGLQRELIGNMSHDLRTPLTMIQGYAETMRDIPEERNPENMQIIIDETNRLASLVNEVLEFSRLRSGTMQFEKKAFDLTATISAIRGRVTAMTEKDGYSIIMRAEGARTAYGDSARIEQVVYNLLGNALTYTGDDKQVTIRQEERDAVIRVSVSDTGKGIDAEELPYVWDRYYRTKESHRRAIIGSGMGLNICRKILENLGAAYGVDSEQGKGTTFWFELPKAEEGAEVPGSENGQ